VKAAYREAITAAERALALAAELDLPEPAGALGRRGSARWHLGDREGLEDMRRALELALEQGQGREAAVLHNNLTVASWFHEGPQAALTTARDGIAFCERRGITESALGITLMTSTFLADLGQVEQALENAGRLADRLQDGGFVEFVEPRSLQLRLLADRGDHELAPPADELVVAARESGEPQLIALAFAGAARLLLAQERPEEARALLLELDEIGAIRGDAYYASLLPDLVRVGLALGGVDVAHRLVEGVEPVTPSAEHALVSCQAQLAEAAGNHTQAGDLYADAAERWREFGNVPAHAFSLLGLGRALVALGDNGAQAPLGEARNLFESMGYRPSLEATERLLAAALEIPV
jgi:tetratricopeptide (TPR) repeat protein